MLMVFDSYKGGFGGHKDHDVHLLFTLSGIQILTMCNKIDMIDKQKTIDCKVI